MGTKHAAFVALWLAFASACGAGSKATDSARDEAHGGEIGDAGSNASGVDAGSASTAAGSGGTPSGSDAGTASAGGGASDSLGASDAPGSAGLDGGPNTGSSESDPTTAPETPLPKCSPPEPGRAPLRQLSSFEYDNTLRDLLGDESRPGEALSPEYSRYMNDSDVQRPSTLLVEQYAIAAKEVAARALSNADVRTTHFPCLDSANAETETACAREIIESFGARAFRRPLDAQTTDELVALQAELRQSGSFEESIGSLLEAMLQAPDFLYRLEFGTEDPTLENGLRRPTGHEMATRLSYLLWGTLPDAELEAAAATGTLDSAAGVLASATSMVADAQARPVVLHFFNAFLGIDTALLALPPPDPELFPTFSATLPELMREETLGFLEHAIFEGDGSWRSALTAPSVYVNEELANYYGIDGVTGTEFRSVGVDPDASHRFGLLTQGSILIGTASSERTNPVRRGLFVATRLMCEGLPEPPVSVSAPSPNLADTPITTRELYERETLASPVCATCHQHFDPAGFALENYDPAGLWREDENGLAIDASGNTPRLGEFDGPAELVAQIAANEQTYRCLADNWAQFGYGRNLDPALDACTISQLQQAFIDSNYDVRALLVASTQTDGFLYLPAAEESP